MLFADLLSLHLLTFLMLFFLVHVTFYRAASLSSQAFSVDAVLAVPFFSNRCMLELKFAIYYRAASFPSQASYAVLAQESLTRPAFLQTLPAHQQYF